MQASGVFEAAAKTETKPRALKTRLDTGIHAESAAPSVVPINTKGINSPPLKPVATLKLVKIILKSGVSGRTNTTQTQA